MCGLLSHDINDLITVSHVHTPMETNTHQEGDLHLSFHPSPLLRASVQGAGGVAACTHWSYTVYVGVEHYCANSIPASKRFSSS